jgi:hypothetical protein
MNSAPSSYQDLARDLDSILSQSAPRPSNQNWPTPPTSNNQNWPVPPTSNIQKSEKRSIGRRMSRALVRYSVVFLIGIEPPWPGSPTATKQWRLSGRRFRLWLGCCPPRQQSRLPTVRHPPSRLYLLPSWRSSLSPWQLISTSCGAAYSSSLTR